MFNIFRRNINQVGQGPSSNSEAFIIELDSSDQNPTLLLYELTKVHLFKQFGLLRRLDYNLSPLENSTSFCWKSQNFLFPYLFFFFLTILVSQENLKGSTIETKQNHPSGEFQIGSIQVEWKELPAMVPISEDFFKEKGKLIHLIGGGQDSSDPKFTSQDEEDSMIMSQLWNSTEPNIAGTCMFLNSAHEIQEDIRQTYSKMRDIASVMRSTPKLLPQNKVHVQLLNIPIL